MIQKNKKRSKLIDLAAVVFIAIGLISAYNKFELPINSSKTQIGSEMNIDSLGNHTVKLKYGFPEDQYHIVEHTLFPDQFLSDILVKYDVAIEKIFELEEKSKDVFNIRNIKAGKKYAIIQQDSCSEAECFIYEPDPFKYVVYNLKDSINVKIVEREVTTKIESTSGIIQSSLWMAMKDQGLSAVLIDKMEDALAWSVDFYHIQQGDKYKLIFERKYIKGEPVGIGKLMGAYYKTADNEFYSIYYENEQYQGYYDLEGRPSKKGFLKSPVKYSRISSYFSKNRLHPILKRNKPHLGTDYAAPYGTPILAVSNGVVTNASYTSGNGKYVKIKHDKSITTQYLHMQKFAAGIKPGSQVKQGQTIGYVGSTGLATGPHVCFRFWKNGVQVNHLKENFPPAEPMPKSQLPLFFETRDQILKELNEVEFIDANQTIETQDLSGFDKKLIGSNKLNS